MVGVVVLHVYHGLPGVLGAMAGLWGEVLLSCHVLSATLCTDYSRTEFGTEGVLPSYVCDECCFNAHLEFVLQWQAF